jgi:hypothetical protein
MQPEPPKPGSLGIPVMNVRAIRPLGRVSHPAHTVSDRIGGPKAPPCPPASRPAYLVAAGQLSEATSRRTPGPIEELSAAAFR